MTVLCDKGCQKSNRKNLFKRLRRADNQRLDNLTRKTEHTAQYDKPHGGYSISEGEKKPGELYLGVGRSTSRLKVARWRHRPEPLLQKALP